MSSYTHDPSKFSYVNTAIFTSFGGFSLNGTLISGNDWDRMVCGGW